MTKLPVVVVGVLLSVGVGVGVVGGELVASDDRPENPPGGRGGSKFIPNCGPDGKGCWLPP